jgi:hypothetical protein
LAKAVRRRFGAQAATVGYSRDDSGSLTLWDVRDDQDAPLWDSNDPDVPEWRGLANAVKLLGAAVSYLPGRGDGLTYKLTAR